MSTDSPAVALLSAQMEERKKIRASWKDDAGDLLDAHEFALSALHSMIKRFSGRRFGEQSRAMEGRMSLSAQFIQGIDLCEVAISEGLYSQAAALLKQQLETICAIEEYENDQRREGETPRIRKDRPSGRFGPIYGDLNGIAHVSKHDVARQLVEFEQGELCGPTIIPKYNRDHARFMYGNHVYFIWEVGRKNDNIFRDLFNEGFSKDETQWQMFSLIILLRENVIDLPEEALGKLPDSFLSKIR